MVATETVGFEISVPVAGIEDAMVVVKVPLMRWTFEMPGVVKAMLQHWQVES